MEHTALDTAALLDEARFPAPGQFALVKACTSEVAAWNFFVLAPMAALAAFTSSTATLKFPLPSSETASWQSSAVFDASF